MTGAAPRHPIAEVRSRPEPGLTRRGLLRVSLAGAMGLSLRPALAASAAAPRLARDLRADSSARLGAVGEVRLV